MEKRRPPVCPQFVRRLVEATFRPQQTQRTLLDGLQVEDAIEKHSNTKRKAEMLKAET